MLPLTGALSEFGIATRNGIEMISLENRNLSIEFIFEDSQYDPKIALSAFHKLNDVDHVGLILNWGTGPNQAVAPVAESLHLPLLAVTAEASISKDRKYIIRFSPFAGQYSDLLLHHLKAKGYSRAAVFHTQIAYFDEFLAGLQKGVPSTVTIEDVAAFSPIETDFRTSLLRISRKQFDVLAIFLVSNQLAPFFSQLNQLNIKLPIVGSNTFDVGNGSSHLRMMMSEAVFPTVDVSKEFREIYIKRFGNEIQIPFAAIGNDFVTLLEQIMLEHNSLQDSDFLVKTLRHSRPFNGATGLVSYKESDGAGPGFDFPVVLKKVTESGIADLTQ